MTDDNVETDLTIELNNCHSESDASGIGTPDTLELGPLINGFIKRNLSHP